MRRGGEEEKDGGEEGRGWPEAATLWYEHRTLEDIRKLLPLTGARVPSGPGRE